MISIIKCDTAFVKEIGTKNDVVLKIGGIDNKGRMFVNNNVSIEFSDSDF